MKRDLDWALTILKRPKKKRRGKKKASSKMRLAYRRKPLPSEQEAFLKFITESS